MQTLLVVDDASKISAAELFGSDVSLFLADSAQSACEALRTLDSPQIVLINLEKVPDEGLALLEEIRKDHSPLRPVVGVCVNAEQIERASLLSADEIILRPLQPTLLKYIAQKLRKVSLDNVQLARLNEGRSLNRLIDTLRTGVGIFEYADGILRVLYLNDTLSQVLALYPEQNARFKENVLSIMTPLGAQRVVEAMASPSLDKTYMDIPLSIPRTDEGEYIIRVHAIRIHYEDREAPVFLGSVTDITAEYRAEKALRDSNIRLESLMKAIPGGYALYDLTNKPRMIYANGTMQKLFGCNVEDFNRILKEDYRQLIGPEDWETINRLVEQYRIAPEEMEQDLSILTRNGEKHWVHLILTPLAEGNLCNVMIIDNTHDREIERRSDQMQSELTYRANYDPLTGINNRESFYRQTAALLREHSNMSYVILVMDINRFKVVNELFGKEVGDSILIAIAKGLRQMLTHVGTYARMESDHFAACFPQQLLDMDRIIRLIEQGLKRQNIDYHLQMSFGIYQIRSIHLPVVHMCDRAFMALKTIKGNALKRYAFYDDQLRQSLLEENAILEEMGSALAQGQFVPYLQPIFAMDQSCPDSAEVLARWKHPYKGIIPPGKFIPLFERTGYITQLDFYIWEQACAILARWKEQGIFLPVSVNMSRNDFYHPHLCEQLLDLTRRYGVHPSQLRLEITESAYSKDPEELTEIIEELRANGFMILLDDFGSGYSSLNVLMDMPVDVIKLDMHFLSKLDTNPRAASVLTSVVRMAKWLRIPIVAEGVSNRDQMAFLRSVGCDHLQGYLLAEPMNVQDFYAWYQKLDAKPLDETENLLRRQVELDNPWDLDRLTNAFFNGMIGGIGIYELSGTELEIRRVNDGFYELFGCTPKQVFDGARDALFNIHPEDRADLMAVCRHAVASGRVERLVCRQYQTRAGRQLWLEARLRFLGKAGENDVFCFAYNDYTEQKEFEQARALRNYATLLRSVYSSVFEINVSKGCYREVYGRKSDEDVPEKPWGELRDHLSRMLCEPDKELEKLIFVRGYLNERLRLQQNGYYLVERQVAGENGAQYWASFTLIRVPTAPEAEVYLLCVADVDSRKRADTLLAENHWLQIKQTELARYQTLLERLDTILVDWDVRTGEVMTSGGFERYAISQFSFRTLTSYKDLEPYVFAGDLDLFRRLINDLLAHGNSIVTIRMLGRDGQPIWCRLFCSLLTDELGQTERCLAAIHQTDEQMKTRENYLDEYTRFHTFADNFQIGLGIFEVRGDKQQILYLNDGYRKMLGYGTEEPFLQHEGGFIGVHPDDVPRFREANSKLIATRMPYTIEYRVFHKDGHILWMRSDNAIYERPQVEGLRIFAVIQDITERKKLEDEASFFTTRMPVAIGIYDLTEAPQVLFENPEMKALFTGNDSASSFKETDTLARIAATEFRDTDSGDEILMLSGPNGEVRKFRLLFSLTWKQDRKQCYCMLVEAHRFLSEQR